MILRPVRPHPSFTESPLVKILNTLLLGAALIGPGIGIGNAQPAATAVTPTAPLQTLRLQAHNMVGEQFGVDALQGKVAIVDEGRLVPPKLPLTLLVNAQGKVVARFEGRLAPEAWDGVADLLP
jgi:hypothetical protein